jgi:hypothetical protein
VQLTFMLCIISFFFGNIAKIGAPNMFVYGGFIFLSVYAYTELMDQNKNAVLWEALKNALAIGWIMRTGDWFGMGTWQSWTIPVLIAYCIVATVVVAWFCWQIKPTQHKPVLANA